MRPLLLLAAVLLAAAPAPLTGTLPEPGVVWISDGSKIAPFTGALLTQRGKAFYPSFAVVPAGTVLRFRNDDEIDHSVYSVSEADPFDLGIYEPGPGKDVAFVNPGVVLVRCHIHRTMRSTLVVVDGPYARVEAARGSWTLRDVRPGRHVLHTWTQSQGEKTRIVEIP